MTLTKEAKLHLMTKVDNYAVNENHIDGLVEKIDIGFYGAVTLKDYDPTESISQFKALWNSPSLKRKQDQIMAELMKIKGTVNDLVDGIDFVLTSNFLMEEILKITGFKGEVWER